MPNRTDIENPDRLAEVIFYKLEKAIKAYRQLAQRELRDAGFSITIDQWLTIKNIAEHPGIKQNDLARMVFKDSASITRIIEILVKSNLVERTILESDRRRTSLAVTDEGLEIIGAVEQKVAQNREKALLGISTGELELLENVIKKITANCDVD